MSNDLVTRLRRLEDTLAIHQLFIDYGLALDAGDFATYARLFAERGELNLGPIGTAVGPVEIELLMSRTMEGRVGTSFHIVSSPQITFIDDDSATSQVMWTVVHRQKDGEPKLTMMGRHVDRLVRENGSWKIASRRGLIDLPSTYRDQD
jgi:3-phenylpropionate/cinnamic acid dioxygenase small subunit